MSAVPGSVCGCGLGEKLALWVEDPLWKGLHSWTHLQHCQPGAYPGLRDLPSLAGSEQTQVHELVSHFGWDTRGLAGLSRWSRTSFTYHTPAPEGMGPSEPPTCLDIHMETTDTHARGWRSP